LPLDPSFACSNPAENDGFIRVIKVRSATSFAGEVKPVSDVVDFYGRIKIPTVSKRYLQAKFTDISRQVSSCFAARCLLLTAREVRLANYD